MNETEPLLKCLKLIEEIDSPKRANFFSDALNFEWIEVSLMMNIFLAGFDGTIAASTFVTIGNEFGAISLASWITSSYMITSTAFQPLYGSFSDILGRKTCIIFALSMFAVGSYGTFLSESIVTLIVMRGITGIGGGGLKSLSTITNSDLIYPEKRGLFQAIQNLIFGLGAVCGASCGGYFISAYGWRMGYAVQVLPTLISILISAVYLENSQSDSRSENSLSRIDFWGSATLVCSLTAQILILSLGGSEMAWFNWRFVGLGLLAIASSAVFIKIETTTSALPIIPVRDFKNIFAVLNIILAFCLGLASYSYLFTLPQLFQITLEDTTTKSGMRLALASLATPVGGITTGVLMVKAKKLLPMLPIYGTLLMSFGNLAAATVSKSLPDWLIDMMLLPANIGQGAAFPSTLFLFVYYFGASKQASSTSTVYLMRSIGGVWGVTYISSVIQFVLRKLLWKDLNKLTNLTQGEILQIISEILKSTDYLGGLEPAVRDIVVRDYTIALRVTQMVSGMACLVAFLCLLVSKSYFEKFSRQWRH